MPDNAQVLQDIYAAFGRGDIPALISGLDQDIAWNAPDVLEYVNPDELIAHAAA